MRAIPKEDRALAIKAHEAIHNPANTALRIDGRLYPITTHRSGSRMIQFPKFTVLEQNKTKSTALAKRAKAGEKLSWVIPNDPNISWQLLENTSE